jgi:hypothetical protein
MTRTTSANPPSFRFVPVCTLIGLWFHSTEIAPGDLVTAGQKPRNCMRAGAPA